MYARNVLAAPNGECAGAQKCLASNSRSVRFRHSPPNIFGSSNQGDRTRLLTENEAGSIPAARAMRPSSIGRTLASHANKEGSIPSGRAKTITSRSSADRAPDYESGTCGGSNPLGRSTSSERSLVVRHLFWVQDDASSNLAAQTKITGGSLAAKASVWGTGDRGFKSRSPDHYRCPLAHLVERRSLKAEVPGSKPGGAANTARWRSDDAGLCKSS